MVDVNKEFKRWGQRVSLHAVPFIATGQKIGLRIIWIFSLILSIALCIVLLTQIISTYFLYEVNTVVQIERDQNREFPAISFCSRQICDLNYNTQENLKRFIIEKYNFNASLNSTFSFEENAMKTLVNNMNMTLKNVMDNMNWSEDTVFNGILDQFRSSKNYSQFLENFLSKESSLNESIISCKFNSKHCDWTDFEFYRLNDYQKCYRFNGGKSFNGTKPIVSTERYGINFGLHLELNLNNSKYCANPFSKTSGLVLYVHNSSYMVTEELMQNGIEIPMGTETNIGINRIYVSKLPLPYNGNNPCVILEEKSSFANEKIEKTVKLNGIYSQFACKQLCQQEFFMREKKCSDPYLPFGDLQMQKCNRTDRNFYRNESLLDENEEYNQCIDKCQIDCDEFRFQFTISNLEFPTLNYVDVIRKKPSLKSKFLDDDFGKPYRDTIKSAVLAFNVYYQTDLYRSIVDSEKMTQTAIVSQVGNYTGLFLGASFLSVVELCGLGLNLVLAMKKQSKTNKNAVQDSKKKESDSDSDSDSDD